MLELAKLLVRELRRLNDLAAQHDWRQAAQAQATVHRVEMAAQRATNEELSRQLLQLSTDAAELRKKCFGLEEQLKDTQGKLTQAEIQVEAYELLQTAPAAASRADVEKVAEIAAGRQAEKPAADPPERSEYRKPRYRPR